MLVAIVVQLLLGVLRLGDERLDLHEVTRPVREIAPADNHRHLVRLVEALILDVNVVEILRKGIVEVVGGLVDLGVVLGLFSAASFALNVVVIRRAVLTATPSQATYLSLFAGIPLLLILSAATGQLFRLDVLPGSAFMYLIIVGVVMFVVGRYANYRCIQALGANASAPLRSMSVLVGVIRRKHFRNRATQRRTHRMQAAAALVNRVDSGRGRRRHFVVSDYGIAILFDGNDISCLSDL